MSDESKAPDVEGSGMNATQMWHYFRRYPYILAKVGLWAIAIGALFIAVRSVEAVLFPIAVSLLVAYLLDPSVDFFEEKGVNRSVTIMLFLALGVIFATLFVLVLYPTIARQVTNVVEKLPQLVVLFEDKLLPWAQSELGMEIPETAAAAMAEYGETVRSQLPTVAKRISSWVAGLLAKTGPMIASLLNIVMIPIFTFYFLRDFDDMRLSTVEFIPEGGRDAILERIRRADEVVGAWFRGQVEVAAILAVLYSIGLGITFGLSGSGAVTGIAIGIVTGFLNIIPYFGVLIGVVLSTLIVILDWSGWGPPLGVAAVFIFVQTLEGYYITPKIVGEKVGLSPVVVIIVLLLGGELFGLLGVLLAIPISGVIRVLLPDIIQRYKATPFYTGELLYDLEAAHEERRLREPDGRDGRAEDASQDEAGLEPDPDLDAAVGLDVDGDFRAVEEKTPDSDNESLHEEIATALNDVEDDPALASGHEEE